MALPLIHPSIRNQVYLGTVVTGLAAASFFRSDLPESIKIIAAMTFSGVSATFMNYALAYDELTIGSLTTDNKLSKENLESRYIRSSNPITNHFFLSVWWAPVFALAGGVFACAARAPIPGLTKKVDINDMKYLRLFIQVVVPLLSWAASYKCINGLAAAQTRVKTGLAVWGFMVGIVSPIGILASRVKASLR